MKSFNTCYASTVFLPELQGVQEIVPAIGAMVPAVHFRQEVSACRLLFW